MKKRQKLLGKFVVTRGDASETLETEDVALDQIVSVIEMPIEFSRREAI